MGCGEKPSCAESYIGGREDFHEPANFAEKVPNATEASRLPRAERRRRPRHPHRASPATLIRTKNTGRPSDAADRRYLEELVRAEREEL